MYPDTGEPHVPYGPNPIVPYPIWNEWVHPSSQTKDMESLRVQVNIFN